MCCCIFQKAHYLHKLEKEIVERAEVVEPKYKPDVRQFLQYISIRNDVYVFS